MQALQVGVFDFGSEAELRFSVELPEGVEYGSIGNFSWAPDMQIALFIIAYSDSCFPSGYSLRRMNFATGQVINLLEKENQTVSFLNQTLSILEWKESYRALVSIDGQNYWLDPNSGEISVAPLPFP